MYPRADTAQKKFSWRKRRRGGPSPLEQSEQTIPRPQGAVLPSGCPAKLQKTRWQRAVGMKDACKLARGRPRGGRPRAAGDGGKQFA